jgi:GntR family transcriptional regulator
VDVLDRIAAAISAEGADSASSRPKYAILYDQILKAIEVGAWSPGDRLPPDSQFAQALPVSLGTVQKALTMLADAGVIIRRHGHGTFVATAATPEEEVRHFHFIDGADRHHLPVYARVLSVDAVRETGPWSRFLAPETEFVRISRVVSVNLEFQTWSQVYLPRERFGFFLDMPPRDLERASINYMLATRFSAPMLRVVQYFHATAIPDEVCERVGVPTGSVGMHWEIYGYSYRDAPISYQHVYVPQSDALLRIGDPPTIG